MFTLLRRTAHGWTDIHGPAPAEFATPAAAWYAACALDNDWQTSSDWKIVPNSELGNYDIVG